MTISDFIPDPYAAALEHRRTPAEQAYVARRDIEFHDIEARASAVSAEVAATLRVLAEHADLANYKPPCPYCAAVKKLRGAQ